jgi:hypothetical protein
VFPLLSTVEEGTLGHYSRMWCPGLIPIVKLHTLHGLFVVPAGMSILLGLYNPPRRGCGKSVKPGLLYPLVCIPCYGTINTGVLKQSRLRIVFYQNPR